MTQTALDTAFAAMQANPDDDTARLRYYERLADAELFMALEGESDGEAITPQLFDLEGETYVIAFDLAERLTSFSGPTAFAALSGRNIAALLVGEGMGLAVNLETPSAYMVPPDAVAWLEATLSGDPEEAMDQPAEFTPPGGLPEALITALDQKLVTAQGLAKGAYLVGVTYTSGRKSHLLAFLDAVPGAEQALAKATSEALVFSGVEAGTLDVTMVRATDPAAPMLAKVGLRFDIPEPETGEMPGAPGMDPDRPPKLV